MKLKISNFISQDIGYKEEIILKIGDPIENLVLSKPINANLTLMRLKEGISAKIEDLETSLDMDCVKCLKSFSAEIRIPYATRIYYIERPASYDDEVDQPEIFMVDLKQNEIDLTEMIRQEILLHFPTYQVCSKSCKGLCSKCGTDLNKKKCKCKREKLYSEGTYKPFENLKNLINP